MFPSYISFYVSFFPITAAVQTKNRDWADFFSLMPSLVIASASSKN